MLVGDGVEFTGNGVIVVTFNYPLVVLGFFHFARPPGARVVVVGQWRTVDEIAALTWIRENISGFGVHPGTAP